LPVSTPPLPLPISIPPLPLPISTPPLPWLWLRQQLDRPLLSLQWQLVSIFPILQLLPGPSLLRRLQLTFPIQPSMLWLLRLPFLQLISWLWPRQPIFSFQ
tara:strand:+ start:181 stop:483 length:303 start_codon:yes stop_codon:yes gene_type:complete